jgi:glycosyltransferase involved in cell wall biosynthesis
MRICLYTNTALPSIGGQELVVDALARQFVTMGHDVRVLCPLPPRGLTTTDQQLTYRVVRHARFVSTRWLVGWYTTALQRLFNRWPYEVLHCHNVYPSGYLAALHKKRGGPPVVLTSHGGDVRSDNPRFRKPGLRDRHGFAVRHADRIISISKFTEEGFLSLGATHEQLVTIPNGVNTDLFTRPVPRPPSLPLSIQSRQFVLFLGRLVALKGVDVLLRAIHTWRANTAGGVPHVVIAGDGQERKTLEALRTQLQQESQVSFIGQVQGEVKVWLLQNAFALAIPSREREAFPLVLLEGYAAGCAVVAGDAQGLRDLIDHQRTGWVVPRNEPAALANALRHLWEHPELTEPVRASAHDVARACDWRRIAERHVVEYDHVLATARHGRRAA